MVFALNPCAIKANFIVFALGYFMRILSDGGSPASGFYGNFFLIWAQASQGVSRLEVLNVVVG